MWLAARGAGQTPNPKVGWQAKQHIFSSTLFLGAKVSGPSFLSRKRTQKGFLIGFPFFQAMQAGAGTDRRHSENKAILACFCDLLRQKKFGFERRLKAVAAVDRRSKLASPSSRSSK
ncbi:MAG TPA: hypothetical protein P5055_19985 [Candidatus Paceibacterota bacterium]|nr:hypothetical protein [Candidatus Paceibacterota bacterium]